MWLPVVESEDFRPLRRRRREKYLSGAGSSADAVGRGFGGAGPRRQLPHGTHGRGEDPVLIQCDLRRRAHSAASGRRRQADARFRGQRHPQLYGGGFLRVGAAAAVLPGLRHGGAAAGEHGHGIRAQTHGRGAQVADQGVYGRILPHPPRAAAVHHRAQGVAGGGLRPLPAASGRHVPVQRRQRRGLLPHGCRGVAGELPRIALPAIVAGRDRPHGRPHQPHVADHRGAPSGPRTDGHLRQEDPSLVAGRKGRAAGFLVGGTGVEQRAERRSEGTLSEICRRTRRV